MDRNGAPETQELVIQFSILENETAYVSSREVAKKFGKRPDNVLQAIETVLSYEGLEQFSALNFKESSYVNTQQKTQPEILMTRDGFCLIAMGFTGEEAVRWKIKFLEAFDKLVSSASQLQAKIAQLEALNQKLLEPKSTKPRSPRSSHVALAEKKIAVLETVDGESKLVQKLASSLSLVELARAVAAARDAQATGSRAQARLARKWACAVEDWCDEGCQGNCPDPLDYMNSCEYAGFFQEIEEDEE